MNKKTKYAMNGALIGGLANALINSIKQINQMDKDPSKDFNWGEMFGAAGKGALIGGASGLAIGAIADHQNSLEEPVDTSSFLYSVVDEVKLDKNDSVYKRLDGRANRLIEILNAEIGDKLYGEPMRLGSTEKGTALFNKFDIDICLPFKPGSFSSTGEMFSYLLKVLEKYVGYESIIRVQDQKKSLGVIFELRGEEHKIDIVPYKITKSRGNKTSGYLYLNDPSNPSYTKTDIHALKSFKLSETQKKIVLVLKHWKVKNKLPISSYLLENLVKDAYQYNSVPKDFTKKVIMVLRHIKDNLDVAVIKSVENTNNVLTDISDSKKAEIIKACKKVIDEYEYQPNSVLKNFQL